MNPLLFFLGLGALILAYLIRRAWSDMPIRFDRPMWCEKCQATTTHTVTAYKDEEIRTCSRCHTRTIYEVVGKELKEVSSETPDATKEEFNFKRQAPRKYRKRRKKGDEEEDTGED